MGDGEKRLESGILDDVSDSDGKSYGWHPRYKFSELVSKVKIFKFSKYLNIFRYICNNYWYWLIDDYIFM